MIIVSLSCALSYNNQMCEEEEIALVREAVTRSDELHKLI